MGSEYAPLKAEERLPASMSVEIDEVDASYKVDWENEKDERLAQKYHQTLMARCSVDGENGRAVLDVRAGYESVKEGDIHKWPLWSTTHDELGTIGGPGALVYFEFLYRLRVVFFILAVLNTPSIYLNLYSEHNLYDSELITRTYKTWTARTTLGSVYEDEHILDADAGPFSGHAGAMWVRTILDAFSVALFAKFVIQWKWERERLAVLADEAACSMADYTVSVRPQDDWPVEFDRSLDDDPMENDFIEKLSNHFSIKYGPVAVIADKPAIWLAFSEREVIQLSRRKCDELLKLEEALGAACAADWSDGQLNATVKSVAEKVKRTNKAMHRLRSGKTTAVEAFVTFESNKHAEKAIADSDNFGEFSDRKCTLRTPPEPSSLHWDRLPTQPVEQAFRKYGILIATIIVLLIGFTGMIQADVWKGNTAYLGGCTDAMAKHTDPHDRTVVHHGYCDPFEYPERPEDRINGWQLNMSDLPPDESLERSALATYKDQFETALEALGVVHVPRAVTHKKGTHKPYIYPDDYVCDIMHGDTMDGCCTAKDNEMTWREAQEKQCHRIDMIVEEKCKGPDGHKCDTELPPNAAGAVCPDGCTSREDHSSELLRGGDIDAICYMCLCECDNHLGSSTYISHEPACFDISAAWEAGREDYCKDYKDYRRAQKMNKLLGVFIVVSVNTLIKTIIVKSQPFMGLHDQSADMGSIAFRTFLLQFCNTGLLVLILRADQHLPVLDAAPTEKFGNVCAKWYATVGAPLIKTMVINFLAPAMTHFGKTHVISRCKRIIKGKKAVTQNGLNKAYADSTDDWNMAAAYAELLMPMALCLLYSSGIPLLLWVAAFGLTFKYWVDKWCMLRLYEKPVLVDDDMFKQFGGTHGIMAVVLLLKVALGTWLYASAGGQDPRHEPHSNVLRPYVIPYLLTGVVVVVYWIGVRFSRRRGAGDEIAAREDLSSFSEAYEAGLLVNEDYDYEMDDVEHEENMEAGFADAIIDSAEGDKTPPDEILTMLIRSVWDGGVPDEDTLAAFESAGIKIVGEI